VKTLAIIRNELWQRRRGLIWWSVGVIALISIDMLLYKSIKQDTQDLSKVVDSMPASVKALFAGNADFFSPSGFLSARVYYLLLPLLLSIFAIGVGSSLIGKEERQGTLELLLARPLSRAKLLFSKFGAGVVLVGIVGLVGLLTALICLRPSGFDTVSFRAIALVTLSTIMLSALFGVIAFTLSSFGGKFRGMATGLAALIAFGSYLLASLESLVSWIVWPARILPYHYYNPNGILEGRTYGLKVLLGFFVTIVALLIAAWIGFRRRDIG
jgi:ABC-2 type transport system permease protein